MATRVIDLTGEEGGTKFNPIVLDNDEDYEMANEKELPGPTSPSYSPDSPSYLRCCRQHQSGGWTEFGDMENHPYQYFPYETMGAEEGLGL